MLDAGLRGLAQHYLDAMVAGLSSGVLLAAADDFAIGGDVVETVLAGLKKRMETVGLAVGLDSTDAVFATGFNGIPLAGLHDFAIDGAQVIPILTTALEDLESCHKNRKMRLMR